MPSLVEIGPVVLHGEEDENVKSLQTYGWTNSLTDRWQIIRKAHLSSGELKKLKRELNFAEIFLKKCTMTFFSLGNNILIKDLYVLD